MVVIGILLILVLILFVLALPELLGGVALNKGVKKVTKGKAELPNSAKAMISKNAVNEASKRYDKLLDFLLKLPK